MRFISNAICLGVLTLPVGFGCKKSEPELAPAASALASAQPTSAMAAKFLLDTPASGITFSMDAELEKISGRAPSSASGELFVDLMNVEKSSGLIKVNLDKLSIYKRNRDDAEGEFGEEEKSEKQKQHMRNWFQIAEDAPKKQRERNRWVEFKISKVRSASVKNVAEVPGPKRQVTATVTGEFLLHGRKTVKSIEAELSFDFDGDKPTGLGIKTTKPFEVGLDEHDVRPRKAFDQLADATLDALGAKVAKVAKVEIDARATAR
jgi:hypothetical protein